jgi:tRNA pseudouridine55 synthase
MNGGYLLLNKAVGISSFEALYPVKRALQTKKVGHTGTLDPFASGLLIALTGSALKLSSFICAAEKQYEAVICFGEETDTLDLTGNVTARAPLPEPAVLKDALPRFCGNFLQTPPAFSALHIKGKRAYEFARAGEPAVLAPRSVSIYELKLNDWTLGEGGGVCSASIKVRCSSGTYIRALARDIALAAGTYGYLKSLLRSDIGRFSLKDAVFISKDGGASQDEIRAAQLPVDKKFFSIAGIACACVKEQAQAALKHGKPLGSILNGVTMPESETAALFCGDLFTALLKRNGQEWRYGFVV